jgi:RHS repeat-associated protein
MIHNDHLGTPQKMTDSSGTIVWAADYKPFGEATITVSTITNNLRFPGQYYDAETGNHYNYFRDYNPVIGSYIEIDPLIVNPRLTAITALSRLRPYIYAINNPIRWKDFFGLQSTGEQCKKPDPCKEKADKFYKDCTDKMDKLDNFLTGACVVVGVGTEAASGAGWPLMAGTAAACFVPDWTSLIYPAGKAHCGMKANEIQTICEQTGE